jgi:hypothetical protein
LAEFLVYLNRVVWSLAGFPVMAWLWYRHGGASVPLAAIVLGIPLVFGYLIPGLAILWLRLWEINSRFSYKGIQIHQGFIYASGLSLDAYAAHHVRFASPWATVIVSCLLTGCIVGFTGWFIDIAGVKAGRIRIDNPPARAGRDPATIVTYYAPACYFTLGFCYMLAVHLVWAFLGPAAPGLPGNLRDTVTPGSPSAFAIAALYAAGFLLTAAPAGALYLYLQKKGRSV